METTTVRSQMAPVRLRERDRRFWGNRLRRLAVALFVLATACAQTSGSPDVEAVTPPDSGTATSATESTDQPEREIASSQPEPSPACQADTPAQPWTAEYVARAEVVLERDGVIVEAVVYPHPDYDGRPWSQWGQGIVTDDGRFISAIGDHHGQNGNSFLYEYAPATGELTLFADVQELTDHERGSWGYGKVHAQMVEGPCGIYVATYWGSRRNLVLDDHYRGDRLLVVDPDARTVSDLSLILDGYGVPSLAASPQDGLIYAEAVDGLVRGNTGPFLVLDGAGQEVFRWTGSHSGFRSMAVDDDGRAYYSTGSGGLARYDPSTNEAENLGAVLPGDILRAATATAPDGTIFAVTKNPPTFFSLAPDGRVEELADAQGYTASMALAPDGDAFYYVPFAHGGSAEFGTPLLSVETATGNETEVVLLNDAIERAFGLTLGGTYNIAVSDDGSTVFLGMNAGEIGARNAFGEVVLLIIQLPR